MLNIRVLILQAKISEAENWLLERIGDLKIDDMTFEKIHSGILTFQKKKKKKKFSPDMVGDEEENLIFVLCYSINSFFDTYDTRL